MEGEDAYEMYTDSDHAGDRVLTKRSQTGVLKMLNGVEWGAGNNAEERKAAEDFNKQWLRYMLSRKYLGRSDPRKAILVEV